MHSFSKYIERLAEFLHVHFENSPLAINHFNAGASSAPLRVTCHLSNLWPPNTALSLVETHTKWSSEFCRARVKSHFGYKFAQLGITFHILQEYLENKTSIFEFGFSRVIYFLNIKMASSSSLISWNNTKNMCKSFFSS